MNLDAIAESQGWRAELPPILSVAKAAEFLGVSTRTAYNYVAAGDLETVTLNDRVWVLRDPLLAKLQVATAAASPDSSGS